MPNIDPFDAISNMTRSAMDDVLNKRVLSQHNSAYMVMMGHAYTQHGRDLQTNLLVGEHAGRWTRSGQTAWDRSIRNVFASGRIEWARFIKSMNVDGFDYERQVGKKLHTAFDSGSFSVGKARTLVSLHLEEAMGTRDEMTRDINNAIHFSGTQPSGGEGFLGFDKLTAAEESWAGNAPDAFGKHKWNSALLNKKPYINAPLTRDMEGNPFSLFGEFEDLMIDLNHGGSQATPLGVDVEYQAFIAQRIFSDILKSPHMRGVLRRSTTGEPANAEISGIKATEPLRWDAYNLTIYPDSMAPNTRVVVINKECVRLAQISDDQTFTEPWRLGADADTALVPFSKSIQLWADDRSQSGALYNIGSHDGSYVA